MKLAFSAPTRDEQQTRELFEGFKAAGYQGLQLKPAQYHAYLDEPEALLEAWPQLRGAVSGLICAGRLDEAGRTHLGRVCRFAGAVRAERIIFCHGEPREPLTSADLERFADQLDELGGEAREQGTKLSLHHHHNQPCMHRRDFDIFFGRARSFGLTVDTAHLAKSGIRDLAEVIRTFGWAIDNFHMKDFAEGQFRVLGQGEIDFEPIHTAVHAIGYDGWVAADEESGGEIATAMQACFDAIVDGLAAAKPRD